MKKTCKNCGTDFEITDDDLKFYDKISPILEGKKYEIPPPTYCPTCRQQRRLAFRNEMALHHRKCDATGNQIVSMYSTDSSYTVYDQDAWWSDDWDPLSYGKDYDFDRPFFDQFQDLRLKVPRMSLNVLQNENSYFTNYSLHNKDSYLIYTADYNEKCYYGRFVDRNYRCCDIDFTYDSTDCYEVIHIHKCNRCFFSQKCNECSELYFCYDMRNCQNCLFCGNLRNKQYHIFNQPVTPEKFEAMKAELLDQDNLEVATKKAQEFLLTLPRQCLENLKCEDCIGDYLQSSQRAVLCFDSYDLQDVKFGSHLFGIKDCYDWDFVGGVGSEVCYEMASCAYQLVQCAFCMNSWEGNSNLYYSDLCIGNKHCFGCIGIRQQRYCILNKQYTKEEYEALLPKVIAHMQSTGEWGQFFPIEMSPFGYNESVAFEYYPLTVKEVKQKQWNWQHEDDVENGNMNSTVEIPKDLSKLDEKFCDNIFTCDATGKPYKIIKQELEIHQELKMPLPQKSPLRRHQDRSAKRNPRRLYQRKCTKCSKEIHSTYASDRPEIVYCEECYLKEVY